MRNDDNVLRGGIPKSLWPELCITPQNDSEEQRETDPETPRMFGKFISYYIWIEAWLLSYHLSINKEKRPQLVQTLGITENPDKINTRMLCWDHAHQAIATANTKITLLLKNARAFCQLLMLRIYLSFTRKKENGIKKQ